MIRQDRIGSKLLVAQANPTSQGCKHDAGNWFLAQVHGTMAGGVEIAMHPDEGLSVGELIGRRVQGLRQAAV